MRRSPKFIAVVMLFCWSLGIFFAALVMELGGTIRILNVVAWGLLVAAFGLRIIWRREIFK